MGYSSGIQGRCYQVPIRELTERENSVGSQRACWFEFEPSFHAAGASQSRTSFDEERLETLECVLQELLDENLDPYSRGACLNLLRHLARAHA